MGVGLELRVGFIEKGRWRLGIGKLLAKGILVGWVGVYCFVCILVAILMFDGGGSWKLIGGDSIRFGGSGFLAGGSRRLIIPLLILFFLNMAILPRVTNTMTKYNQHLMHCEKIHTLVVIKECIKSHMTYILCCIWEIFNYHSGLYCFGLIFSIYTIAEEYELQYYFITIPSCMNYDLCIHLG